jgi:hypothetical protein
MTRQDDYDQIARYIEASDLPRKEQKLDGLRRAALKKIRMALLSDPSGEDIILVDGIAIDPSELENGYWL